MPPISGMFSGIPRRRPLNWDFTGKSGILGRYASGVPWGLKGEQRSPLGDTMSDLQCMANHASLCDIHMNVIVSQITIEYLLARLL